ncbi:hypothetical protein SAMN05428959_105374 [Duganella sp. CF517]|uniref:FkbM family methyltransferase n=1 Tax=Duganella sp. CF517 TaxID=1881038 RepID=UPI0008AAD2A5|nr:FkbM family methyltransferase [Duganella sp. CF517]SEO21123.1 hypothetical protein SAMN05428959_105374 [Duganella sp. CF517]
MSLTSYAHNFEDVLLVRALGHLERGVYVDTAAGEPLRGNATQALYERGWRGVNLEPSPARLRRLRIARPADVNLAVAAAGAPGERTWFELGGEDGGAATFDAALARRHRAAGHDVVQHSVALDTLDALCARHLDGALHVLRLGEADALDGLDLERWRPWIIVLRAAGTAPLAALAAARYALAHADGHSQFYVADEHRALAPALALPPHPADDFVLCEDHHYSHPLTALRRRAEQAEADAEAARAWAKDHVREWRQKFDRVEAAEQRAAAADQRAGEADQRAAVADQRAADALARLSHTGERLRAAEAELPLQLARANHAEGTLAGVYASASWRLTRPLRAGNLLRARATAWSRALPGRVARALLRRAKGAAGVALRYVNARPRLSFFLRRNLARLPFMVPLMRRLKLRLELNARHGAAPAAVHAELDDLPDSARRVFDDLGRARPPHS